MRLLSYLFVLPVLLLPLTARPELLIPKDLQSLTPIQKQYAYLLAAFRQTTGADHTMPDAPAATLASENRLVPMPLPPHTQTEMALELMTRLDTPAYDGGNRACFSSETWQSLRLIGQEPNVLAEIAPNIKTLFGRLFLARLLTMPTTDIQRIKDRQGAMKELCRNQKALKEITTICSSIAQVQEQLLGLTSNDHPLYDPGLRIYQHEFFFRSFGPRKNQTWNRIAKLFGDGWYAAGLLALPALNIKGVIGYQRCDDAKLEKLFKINPRLVGGLLALLIAYNGLIQLPGIVTWIRARFKALNYFYEALRPLKIFFSATQALKRYLDTIPALRTLSDEIDDALTLKDPDAQKLRNLLIGRAFRSRNEAHLWGGDLILAIDLLRTCKGTILKGIGLIGGLDAYSSLASWYHDGKKSEERPLCLAHFIEKSPTPQLYIQDFWHVLLRTTPILNTLQLGGQNPQNVIVTGVFESGKSTVLQSVALNVVCAQSIGICLARHYRATPYANINIYANIKDDLASDRSLFKTELLRALQLLEQIRHLEEGQFSFTMADVTFTGTEARAGQAAAYAVARYLGELPNSIALHATNFLSLSILEKQDPLRFINYVLPTTFNGATTHTYQLVPGSQTPQLSTAIFKEEHLPLAMIIEMEAQLANIGT